MFHKNRLIASLLLVLLVFGQVPVYSQQVTRVAGVTHSSGSGSPEGVVAGNIGDEFHCTASCGTTYVYIKSTAGGNTGWVASGTGSGGGGGGTTINSGAVTLIQTQTLGADAADFTFSSIPQTYQDLQLTCYGRVTEATTSDYIYLRFNGDTAANYDDQKVTGNTSSAASGQTNGGTKIRIAEWPGTSSSTTTQVAAMQTTIPSYASTAFDKAVSGTSFDNWNTTSGSNQVGTFGGKWRSTAAITSLTLIPTSNNFKTGSSCSLYGAGGTAVGTAITTTATPQVLATNSGTQNISDSTATTFTLDTESYDTSTMHDVSTNTGRITIPVAGKYAVSCQTSWGFASVTGFRYEEVRLNGSTAIRATSSPAVATASNTTDHSLAFDRDFIAGDYIECRGFQNSGSTLTATVRFASHRIMDSATISSQANIYVGSGATTSTILTDESTASTSYVDLATAGPSITLTTGTSATIWTSVGCMYTASAPVTGHVSVVVSGATTVAVSDNYAMYPSGTVNNTCTAGARSINFTGLNPGQNTFKMQYKVESGTGHFQNRTITGASDSPVISSAAIIPGDFVLLATQSASSSAQLDFISRTAGGAIFQSDYDDYLVEVVNVVPATDNVGLVVRMSTDGGSTYDSGSNYAYASEGATYAFQAPGGSATATSFGLASQNVDTTITQNSFNASFHIYNPLGTTLYKVMAGFSGAYANDGNYYTHQFAGNYKSTSAVNAIRFLETSGNIASGTIRIYGLAKTSATTTAFATPGDVHGRLTTETLVPVSTSDRTAQSTIYWTPYKGSTVVIQASHGGAWERCSYTEKSLALSALTSDKNYDVFLTDAGSCTLTLELSAAWTNDTTRADAIALQDGVWVRSGATNKLFIGTIRTTSTTATEDSCAKRFVWNVFNRVNRSACQAAETTDSWTYNNGTTWRQANANTANQLAFVVGLVEDNFSATLVSESVGSNVFASYVGIGVNSTTTAAAKIGLANTIVVNSTVAYTGVPGLGYNFIAWLEASNGGTTTFYGDASAPTLSQSAIVGMIPD